MIIFLQSCEVAVDFFEPSCLAVESHKRRSERTRFERTECACHFYTRTSNLAELLFFTPSCARWKLVFISCSYSDRAEVHQFHVQSFWRWDSEYHGGHNRHPQIGRWGLGILSCLSEIQWLSGFQLSKLRLNKKEQFGFEDLCFVQLWQQEEQKCPFLIPGAWFLWFTCVRCWKFPWISFSISHPNWNQVISIAQ